MNRHITAFIPRYSLVSRLVDQILSVGKIFWRAFEALCGQPRRSASSLIDNEKTSANCWTQKDNWEGLDGAEDVTYYTRVTRSVIYIVRDVIHTLTLETTSFSGYSMASLAPFGKTGSILFPNSWFYFNVAKSWWGGLLLALPSQLLSVHNKYCSLLRITGINDILV